MLSVKATICCENCQGTSEAISRTVEAPTKDLGSILSALLVAWHATPPHCPHRMRIEFEDSAAEPRETHEVVVRCLKPGCENAPPVTRAVVPIELVGAIVISHHTSHEAHPLEFSYNGDTFRSPT